MNDATHLSWVITVVTKADLWWGKQSEILRYYSEGDYAALLQQAGVSSVVAPYSSVFHKFYDKTPLSGEFDDALRKATQGHLVRTLLAAIGKGVL